MSERVGVLDSPRGDYREPASVLGLGVLASPRHVSTPSFNVMGFVELSFVLEPGTNAVHRHRWRRSHLTFKVGIWWALFRIKWFLQNLNYHCSTFLVLVTFISKSMISLTAVQNSVVFFLVLCLCVQVYVWIHAVVKNSIVTFPSMFICVSVCVDRCSGQVFNCIFPKQVPGMDEWRV